MVKDWENVAGKNLEGERPPGVGWPLSSGLGAGEVLGQAQVECNLNRQQAASWRGRAKKETMTS